MQEGNEEESSSSSLAFDRIVLCFGQRNADNSSKLVKKAEAEDSDSFSKNTPRMRERKKIFMVNFLNFVGMDVGYVGCRMLDLFGLVGYRHNTVQTNVVM